MNDMVGMQEQDLARMEDSEHLNRNVDLLMDRKSMDDWDAEIQEQKPRKPKRASMDMIGQSSVPPPGRMRGLKRASLDMVNPAGPDNRHKEFVSAPARVAANLHSSMRNLGDIMSPPSSPMAGTKNSVGTIPTSFSKALPSDTTPTSAVSKRFTEAIPLSLSSQMKLEDADVGVQVAIRKLTSHLCSEVVKFSRAVYPSSNFTVRDIVPAGDAWELKASMGITQDHVPPPMRQVGFNFFYERSCVLHLSPGGVPLDQEDEPADTTHWQTHGSSLGKLTLRYGAATFLSDHDLQQDPESLKLILWQVSVEYRSLPPVTSDTNATHMEEVSMLSLGGYENDVLKYAALAGLNDKDGKYVFEISSPTGKHYKFDVTDATLSNGTVFASKKLEGDRRKNICVTVTSNYSSCDTQATLMGLTLSDLKSLELVDQSHSHHNVVQSQFRLLRLGASSKMPGVVTSFPSGHALLLDPEEAGKVYINGEYLTTWGKDKKMCLGMSCLFGFDLLDMTHSANHTIRDFDAVKLDYSKLLQEVLVNASFQGQNVVGRLLARLMYGVDTMDGVWQTNPQVQANPNHEVHQLCLESELISSRKYDPVGLSARAVATHFMERFGRSAYPCLATDLEYAKLRLGGLLSMSGDPIVAVPQRCLDVLRRTGIFVDIQSMLDGIWSENACIPAFNIQDAGVRNIIDGAIDLLKRNAGVDLSLDQILVTNPAASVTSPMSAKFMCRYNPGVERFFINDAIFQMPLDGSSSNGSSSNDENNGKNGKESQLNPDQEQLLRSYMMGLHIAQEHPDGRVLISYAMKQSNVLA